MAEKPFPRWRAGIRTLVQGGAWRWALALGFAIALGGGAWAYDVFGPQVRTLWPVWKAEGEPWLREALLWIEFLASITLTIAILSWFTALFFCFLCVLMFGLPHLLDWLAGHIPRQDLDRLRHTVDDILSRDRLWGTLLNLLSSFAALATLASILRRPLDYWDIGIQVVISAAVELIVLQVLFAQGRVSWPASRTF